MKNTPQDTAETVNGRQVATVALQTKIARTGGDITELKLMKPRTGDLRGLMLMDVMQMKADTMAVLIPRISVPTLTKPEVDAMDPADLVAAAVEVANFLVPTAVTESLAA